MHWNHIFQWIWSLSSVLNESRADPGMSLGGFPNFILFNSFSCCEFRIIKFPCRFNYLLSMATYFALWISFQNISLHGNKIFHLIKFKIATFKIFFSIFPNSFVVDVVLKEYWYFPHPSSSRGSVQKKVTQKIY